MTSGALALAEILFGMSIVLAIADAPIAAAAAALASAVLVFTVLHQLLNRESRP